MPFTTPINISTPAGTESLSQGDERIRESKSGIQELLGVDHETTLVGNEINSSDSGCHNKITLLENGSDPDAPTGVDTNFGILYTKVGPESALSEIFFKGEDDNVLQITRGGTIILDEVWLTNDTALTARNALNTANLSLIKMGSDNLVEIPSKAKLSATTAVGDDTLTIVNKGFLDSEITDAIDENTVKYMGSNISDYGVIGDYTNTFASDSITMVSGERYLIMTHGSCTTSDSNPNFGLIVKKPGGGETLEGAIANGARNDHNQDGHAFAINTTYLASESGAHTIYIKGNIAITAKGYGIITIRI